MLTNEVRVPLPRRVLLVVLLLVGCTTPHGRVGTLPALSDPEQAAEIVVIREWRVLGGAANLTVTLDAAPLYGISTDEHVIIAAPPGDYVVGVAPRGLGANEATVSVRAEGRRRYYFRVETGSMYYPGPLLLPAAASVGEALLEKTSQVK